MEYPTEYRGNTIYDEKKVSELNPENKPNLQLIQDSYDIHEILDREGIENDPESIVLEDSYNCLWVDTEEGEFSEIWGIHKTVPFNHLTAVRLK